MGARGGARSHKVASAPSPRPGTALGSGKTQKTVVAVPTSLLPPPSAPHRRPRRRGLGAGAHTGRARPQAGASLDAWSRPARSPRAAPAGAPRSAQNAAEARGRRGEKRQDLLGPKAQRDSGAGPGRCPPRGPGRKALAQPRAGSPRRGRELPSQPAARRAPLWHGTERRRHAPRGRLSRGGSPGAAPARPLPTDHTLSPRLPPLPPV